MVWLEIGCLAHTCARDMKLGTHLEVVNSSIFKKNLVQLELKLWALTLTPSLTLSALGLVPLRFMKQPGASIFSTTYIISERIINIP